jgi:hypothetical protein
MNTMGPKKPAKTAIQGRALIDPVMLVRDKNPYAGDRSAHPKSSY